ncbi:hypothetical protein DSO57_1038138 [Entomophthora muscae]|uniref:Uncharacterized protein n=1 Tax=Entomophthora muscae TaxID=34485 RepID=A0ACC2S0Q7_9FUNG|nr:hypothetical protein DSO57_1038138 [Entomophthora muscae]
MQESGDYKAAAAFVGVYPKYASKTFNRFINTGHVLAAEKSLHVSIMFTKEHKWAISHWITQNCHLELANIQSMVKSTFGVKTSISFYYHLVVTDSGLTSLTYHYLALDSYCHYLPVTKL